MSPLRLVLLVQWFLTIPTLGTPIPKYIGLGTPCLRWDIIQSGGRCCLCI